MKIKAIWRRINPFHPNISQLAYSKTIEFPDGTALKDIEEFAKEDSRNGYRFYKLEVLTN